MKPLYLLLIIICMGCTRTNTADDLIIHISMNGFTIVMTYALAVVIGFIGGVIVTLYKCI